MHTSEVLRDVREVGEVGMTNEDAVKWLDNLKNDIGNLYYERLWPYAQAIDEIIELLEEQEVKTGHWIDSAGNDKCSICGEEYSELYPDYGNTHFCPNCGAKMEGR